MNRSATIMRTLLWVFTLWAVLLVPAEAQTTIKDIVDNPGRYSDSKVTVTGTVARHIDDGGNTSTKNYILQADNGSELRVRTTDSPPAIDARFQVEGVVTISAINREPFLDESNRISASQAEQDESTSPSDQLAQGVSTTMIFLMFGLGVLVVVVLAYFAYASSDEPQVAGPASGDGRGSTGTGSTSLSDTELGADGEGGGTPEPSVAGQRIKSESSSSAGRQGRSGGPETLKFKAPPKTMKFIPGKLVVAAGPDQGKEFRIAGHPTPEGNVVTLGRAEVEGERAFAHIQLGDTYRTVSRMQAEIIQQDQDIVLKNKSATNPTIVNGEEIGNEETVPLKDGDMIRMGELMLRYEGE